MAKTVKPKPLNVKRFEVYLVNLDPTVGSEIQKTRPCVVISPDEMNQHLGTVLVAPMTGTIRNYPSRVKVRFKKKDGEVALDQIRAVDKIRLVRRWGALDEQAAHSVSDILVEMFTF